MEAPAIHTPDKGLMPRIQRRMARYRHRALLTPKLDRPLVSLTFDDCPKSVVQTALPLIEAEGWRATIYMACGLCETVNHLGLHMSLSDVKAVAASGHEIGDHTYNHLDIGDAPLTEYQADIARNQATLNALGLPPSRTFAYPYGSVTPELKRALYATFELSRGIAIPNSPQIDLGLAPSTRLYHGPDTARAVQRAQQLKTAPMWETFFTHDVRDKPSDYGCTENDLKQLIKAIKDSGALVLPVAEALDYAKASVRAAA